MKAQTCCTPIPQSVVVSDQDPARVHESSDPDRQTRARWFRIAVGAVLAMNTMVVGLATSLAAPSQATWQLLQLSLLLSTAIVAVLTGGALLHALLDTLRRREIGLETLFAVGIGASLVLSLVATARGSGETWYEVTSLLLVLHAVGAALRQGQQERAWSSLRAVLQLPRDIQRLSCCGTRTTVALEQIQAGDRIEVRAGEVVPIDGTVLQGEALVDAATTRGEPHASPVQPGASILAGTRVLDAPLQVVVTAATGARQVDRVLQAVEQALQGRMPLQDASGRILGALLALTGSIALATALFPVLVAGQPPNIAGALAVLVVSCPCALGFALPLVSLLAVQQLARRGISLREPAHLYPLAQAKVVAFDKTGTLTRRTLRIQRVTAQTGHTSDDVLARVAAVQQHVSHPVAEAFRDADPGCWTATDVRLLPGRGVAARLTHADSPTAGHALTITTAHRVSDVGPRVVDVHADGQLLAQVELSEQLVPQTPRLFARLRALGLHTAVLTGDSALRGLLLDADEVHCGLLAQEKAAVLDRLQRQYGPVLFVGDGVNDAPAAAHAAFFLAAGQDGLASTALAHATWDATSAEAIADAVEIARRTQRVWRQLFGWVIGYNVLAMALAAAGWIHPVVAAVLMTASSLSTVLRTGLFEEELRREIPRRRRAIGGVADPALHGNRMEYLPG